MTCMCVPCSECDGSGSVWFTFYGKYLGRSRCDDMDELQTCDECGGSGLVDMCDECREREEEYEAAEHSAHLTSGGQA